MLIFEIHFWLSLLLIFYAFFGYVLLLWVINLFATRPLSKDDGDGDRWLSVSLIISAYNEDAAIEAKIRNTLELDYPRNRLDIVVVSDASTDGTDKIVKKHKSDGVQLIRQEKRRGKTAALNLAVPVTSGEIVVFSDANSMYAPSAIHELVRPFQDPGIGFVTGWTTYRRQNGSSSAESTGFYSQLEMTTKRLESKIGSCVGADGAIFAIRKKLFVPLADDDINDIVIPLNIVKAGYRGILQPTANCIEELAISSTGEYDRQVRMTTRTLRAISRNLTLLNPLRFPVFSFKLISHKLLKFMVPFFLFGAFVSNLLLMCSSIIYLYTFIAQFSCYTLALWWHKNAYRSSTNRFFDIIYTFSLVGFAMLVGWVKFFAGERFTTWSPQRKQFDKYK